MSHGPEHGGGPIIDSELADAGVKITHTLVHMAGPGAVINILCGLALDGTTTPDDPNHGGGHGGGH